jgi:ATP-dependent Clp protease ATP-binding subunit ClpC
MLTILLFGLTAGLLIGMGYLRWAALLICFLVLFSLICTIGIVRRPLAQCYGMDDRFTERSRQVMRRANQETQRFNHEYVGTEHILLGLLKECSGVVALVLSKLDLVPNKVRVEVEKIVQCGPDMVTMGTLPLTPRSATVLAYALEEARNLQHDQVDTEHLLLGLLREQEGVAAQVLINLGLDLQGARQTIQLLVPGKKSRNKDARVQAPSPGEVLADPDIGTKGDNSFKTLP